mgnify:CR=1 FL=1
MANIQIIQGDFERKLKLQFAPGIKAGFPSPADDYSHETLDFNRDLIRNPEATFYGKVEGDSMIEAGISGGDIAVIDRSVEPQDGDIIVAYINDEFTIKYLDLRHRKDGYIELRPANKNFKPIRIDEDDDFEMLYSSDEAVDIAFPDIPENARHIITSWYDNEGAYEDFTDSAEMADYISGDIVDMLDAASDPEEEAIVRKALVAADYITDFSEDDE